MMTQAYVYARLKLARIYFSIVASHKDGTIK